MISNEDDCPNKYVNRIFMLNIIKWIHNLKKSLLLPGLDPLRIEKLCCGFDGSGTLFVEHWRL